MKKIEDIEVKLIYTPQIGDGSVKFVGVKEADMDWIIKNFKSIQKEKNELLKQCKLHHERNKFLNEENDKFAKYLRYLSKSSARAVERNIRYEKAVRKAINQVQKGSYIEEVVWTLTEALDDYKDEVVENE